jgi:PilZ domain.
MSDTHTARELRRSTRVPLKVVIVAQSVAEPLTCDGETIVVNRHGARISTSVPLRVGMKIEIHVILTGKRAPAEVVYIDAERPLICGVGLVKPENIWGLSLPPDDWYEGGHES